MYRYPFPDEQDEQEVRRYLSWAQKRRIVAAGIFFMYLLVLILALTN